MARRVQWEGEGEAAVKKDGCINCDMKPAKGIYFKRAADDRHMFICEHCGYKDSPGHGTKGFQIALKEKDNYQHAFDNRDRWRRENTEKFNKEWDEAYLDMKELPDGIENYWEVMKPNFDRKPEQDDNEDDVTI